MKKRIFVLLLLTVFVFSAFTFTASADTSDSYAFDVLSALSIGDFNKSDDIVTRDRFASAVSDIINYKSRPTAKNGVFTDVTADSKYSGGVYSLYDMGYISGYGNSVFGANEPIIYEQAVKILVSVLGYDMVANNKGGYPFGYINVANSVGVLDGVSKSIGDTLSTYEAAILIENAMNCDVMLQTGFGDTAVYEAKDGVTLLYEYAKIKKVTGVVSDNGYTSLVGSSKIPDGFIAIDGVRYEDGNGFGGNYLGFKAEAYVTCDLSGNNKVLYLVPSSECNRITITAERLLWDDSSFTTENFVYNDVHGKRQQARISLDADVIYNGVAYADLKVEDLKIDFGEVLLVENTGDSLYDVVIINAVEILIVDATNITDEILYSIDGTHLDIGNSNKIEVFRDGVQTDLSALKYFDVVRASVSLDEKIITLDVSSEKITGKIEEYAPSLGTVKVNGNYYHVATDTLMSQIEFGKEYQFALDSSKNIAAIVGETRSSNTAGIVIEAMEKTGLESAVFVRIFTQNGRMEIFEIADKFSLDGQSELSGKEIVSYIENNMKHKLASYKLNSDRRLTELMLPYESVPGTYQDYEDIRVDYNGKDTVAYSASQKNFGGKAVVDGSTVIFEIPLKDVTSYDDYKTINVNGFSSNYYYTIEAYSVGYEDGVSDYIIYRSDSSFLNEDHPIVVSEVSLVINEDGDTVEKIKGFNYKGAVEYVGKAADVFNSKSVKEGDIIRCAVDENGVCRNVEKIVDGDTKTLQISPKSFFSSPRMVMLNVYSRYGNILNCTTTDLASSFKESDVLASIEKQVVAGFTIYVVDKDEKEIVKPGTSGDIYSYETAGKDFSKIFVHTYSGGSRMMVIYK